MSGVIRQGGVFLDASVCEPIWRILRDYTIRGQANGGRVRPEVVRAVEALRLAAMEHLAATSRTGHDARTFEDIAAACEQMPSSTVTTADLATALGVTERHARRVAAEQGIAPVVRGRWSRTDLESLRQLRRTA